MKKNGKVLRPVSLTPVPSAWARGRAALGITPPEEGQGRWTEQGARIPGARQKRDGAWGTETALVYSSGGW